MKKKMIQPSPRLRTDEQSQIHQPPPLTPINNLAKSRFSNKAIENCYGFHESVNLTSS